MCEYLPLHKSPLVGGGTDSAAKQLTSLQQNKIIVKVSYAKYFLKQVRQK
jgi:hypothetical protein